MITTINKFLKLRDECKQDCRKVVFTNGCFDILHYGHLDYLTRAKKLGDVLIVAVNTDSSIRKFKGTDRPVVNEKERASLVDGLKPVDYVILFSEETPQKIIEKIQPDVLVKGADYKITEIVGADIVRSYNGIVKRIKLVPGISTSDIIRKIRNSKNLTC
ncbi:MAG: D-glycero-beta-D-manno-heptose 1-phosphate adenylyltransferase [candidate division Zixibacteria bacterium]|nr:D-glycero-beta-D-manno-heptose 1-phosphate adenylyltransferase [candidate division Zixibacteria bacterium]